MYEHPRPNRKPTSPTLAQSPDPPRCDVYDFDNHSGSTDEHFSRCLTCNQDTHGHHGSTHSSQTDGANASRHIMAHNGTTSKSCQSRHPSSTSAATNSTLTHPITQERSSSATTTRSTTSTYRITEERERPSTSSTHSTSVHGTSPTILLPSLHGATNEATNSLQELWTNTGPMLRFFIVVPWPTNYSYQFHSPSKKRREE